MPDPSPLVSNAPQPQPTPAPAPVQTGVAPTPAQSVQPTQGQQPGSTTQPQNQAFTPSLAQPPQGTQQPPSATPTVSNLPPAAQASIQRASVLRTIGETLAGGPRYQVSVDPNTGQTIRTPVQLTGKQIGLAIVAEVLSGAMSGLSVPNGPGNEGRAAAAGFQQEQAQRRQADQLQRQQTQQDLQNQTSALARKASIFETNSRTLLNTSEAEAKGADSIDKLVAINRASGALDLPEDAVDNGGIPLTQQQLLDGIKKGTISSTDALGPIAGRTEVTNPDGSTRWEATHLLIRDPNTLVPLTQEMVNTYRAGGVRGYPAGMAIGQNVTVPLRIIQNANEQLASHTMAQGRLTDLRNVLDGTPEAGRVPTSIDFDKPGIDAAMQHFQRYVSHNSSNLEDPYVALQQMGAARRNPTTGEMEPNPDAKWVPTIADTFGGFEVLQAAHNAIVNSKAQQEKYSVIDSLDKAQAVLAAPKKFSAEQVSAAQRFRALSDSQSAEKAAQEARARAVAEGTDVQAMYRFGRNPITGETLSLANAAPSMLVDANGNVIPQDLVSTYKPTAQERQTADTARMVLAISSGLQSELQKNPALAGPLSGRSKAAIAKLGYADGQAQKFLDDISFLQSAATKMHTGRFSNEILKKMSDIVQPGMNADQFGGALASINSVASRYADEDRLRTVADFKQQTATPMNPNPAGGRQVQIPAGAQIGRDGKGNVVGYKLNGKYVPIGGQQ